MHERLPLVLMRDTTLIGPIKYAEFFTNDGTRIIK